MGSKRKCCPECASHYIARSRMRGVLDTLLHYSTGLRPYRCTDCFHRFWRLPSSRGQATSVAMEAATTRESAPELEKLPIETALRRLSVPPPRN